MGYVCGPCGVSPSITGAYIVRPIYNLIGMGVGATQKQIEAGDSTLVPPGYFWCEWFDGPHISTTYKRLENRWEPISSWQGFNHPDNLSRFSHWKRIHDHPPLNDFHELADVEYINVEYINGKPIEIHLRPSLDPEAEELIVPIWADQKLHPTMKFVDDYDDADGYLEIPRIGFYIK